jgi:hypothetical protein
MLMPCVMKVFGTIQLCEPRVQAPVSADMQSIKALMVVKLALYVF